MCIAEIYQVGKKLLIPEDGLAFPRKELATDLMIIDLNQEFQEKSPLGITGKTEYSESFTENNSFSYLLIQTLLFHNLVGFPLAGIVSLLCMGATPAAKCFLSNSFQLLLFL